MKTTPMHPSEFQDSDLPRVVFSFFPWPTRCGFSWLVENGLALQAAVNG